MNESVMKKARRLSAVLVECVKEHPGNVRGFYVEKLDEFAKIILDGQRWPTMDRLFENAFQIARKDSRAQFRDGGWYASTVPICPHCKRVWKEAPSGGSVSNFAEAIATSGDKRES